MSARAARAPAASRRHRRCRPDRLREPRQSLTHARIEPDAGRRSSQRARRQPRAAGPPCGARTAAARSGRRSAGTARRARRAPSVRHNGADRSPARQRCRHRRPRDRVRRIDGNRRRSVRGAAAGVAHRTRRRAGDAARRGTRHDRSRRTPRSRRRFSPFRSRCR